MSERNNKITTVGLLEDYVGASKTLQPAIGNQQTGVPLVIIRGHLKKSVPGPKAILYITPETTAPM